VKFQKFGNFTVAKPPLAEPGLFFKRFR